MTKNILKLWVVLIGIVIHTAGYAANLQSIRLKKKTETLESTLKSISKQSGHGFVYQSEYTKSIDIYPEQAFYASVEDALNDILKGTDLKYKIESQTVILERKPTKDRQQHEIKGTVVDNNNQPLSAAVIRIEGLSQEVSTDANGAFVIRVNDLRSTVIISYVGYETVRLPAKPNMGPIQLHPSVSEMDEVVVVGYGSVRRGDLTGSISSLKPEAIEASKTTSIENLIQGKVAGVSVNGSAASPGAALSVTIRGANSLRGDNQPLYVIDNIPQPSTGQFAGNAFGGSNYETPPNPLTNLNPNDIEDIQILKDASATAIYGSRGANGVIIITTKKGRTGKPAIQASSNFTIAQPTNYRSMLSLEEYANFRNEKSGDTGHQFYFEKDGIHYTFDPDTYDKMDPESYHILSERNWQKEIYRNAFSHVYNVNISGGNQGHRYYVSGDYKNIQGQVIKTGLEQGNLRVNLSSDLSPKVKLDLSMAANLKTNNMMAGGDAKGGATGSITRTVLASPPFEIPAGDPILANEEYRTTALSWINDYEDIINEKSMRLSATLSYKIIPGLTYSLRTGGNVMLQDRARWFGLQLFRGLNDNGSLGISNLNNNNYSVENILNYNTKFSEVVDFDMTVGVTYDDYNWLNKTTLAKDFDFYGLGVHGLHLAKNINESQPTQQDYQLLSYLARTNLGFYDGKYLLTATIRTDGSSKFARENRWATFPSFSAAWRLDKEEFLNGNEILNMLKLRTGYGRTGSQSISPYNGIFDYAQIIDYAAVTGDKMLALAVSRFQNSKLKWETTASYNIGLDFGLFNNRIEGAVEVYKKETNNLLLNKDIPASTSFNSITINQGSLDNKGIEFSLSGDIVRRDDLTWSLSGNIALNRSKIKKLGLPLSSYGNENWSAYLGNTIGDHFGAANIFIEGQAPGLLWGYRTEGIIQSSDSDLPTSSIFEMTPGNIKVVDVTGDGIIDANDRTIIGDPNPNFNYGLQTSISYKRAHVSISMYGVQGGDVVNANLRYEATPAQINNTITSESYHNAWRPDRENNLFPSVSSKIQNVVYDRYIEDASFLRISDITFGYDIPSNKVFNNAHVFLSVKNAFVLTSYSGYDPEMRTFSFDGLRRGIDLNSFSNPRQFVMGINFKL